MRRSAGRIYKIIFLTAMSFLGLAGCDNFSLPAQFAANAGLELLPQKSSVVPGETIELYPNGGYDPYSYGIVSENLVYGSSPGSIADHRYTAATSIGDVRIYLFDQKGNSVSAVVTIVPPAPDSFSVTASTTQNNAVDVEWSWASSTDIISGFRLYRSVDGDPFELILSPGSTTTTYTDTALNQNKLYTYRLYAVSGEYVSKPTPDKSTQPSL